MSEQPNKETQPDAMTKPETTPEVAPTDTTTTTTNPPGATAPATEAAAAAPGQEGEPLIPPQILLGIGVVGLVVALLVLLTQPTFGVVGWAGLAFGIVGLIAWVVMAPEQAGAFMGQRNVRFGGFTVVVSLIVIIALIAVYTLIRGLDLRYDLTESNVFSLSEEGRAVIEQIGSDPSVPQIRIVAFYGPQQQAQRDQDTLLLEDYVETSGGKIEFEFVDINRAPQRAQQLGVTREGQLAVVALDDTGEPLVDNAEVVNSLFNQDELTNAILRATTSGDFFAYFMEVENGLSLTPSAQAPSASQVATLFTDLGWTVESVSFVDLLSPEPETVLNDPAKDGEVMILPGGTEPLTDDELGVVADFVAAGGNLIVLAGDSFGDDDLVALATADNFTTFLRDNFGVYFENNLVGDTRQALQNALLPVATDFNSATFIAGDGLGPADPQVAVFAAPHSLTILEDETPENVTVSVLLQSSDSSFAFTDMAALADAEEIDPANADASGPFVLAAQAENTQTGARVVLFGSTAIMEDGFTSSQSVSNASLAINSLIWTNRYDEYFAQTNIFSGQTPQDAPILADQQTVRYISFLTTIVLPFGVLAIGILVWWTNRERARA